jgi:hypothetical protein
MFVVCHRIINENRAALGIVEYSVSESTLEQIFMSFARTQEEESQAAPGYDNKDDGAYHDDARDHDDDNATLSVLPHPHLHNDHKSIDV